MANAASSTLNPATVSDGWDGTACLAVGGVAVASLIGNISGLPCYAGARQSLRISPSPPGFLEFLADATCDLAYYT
jgi:hypothetical protein